MRKKVLITILAIMGCFCNLMASKDTDAVSIPEVEIMQGEEALVTIYYNFNYENGSYSYRGAELKFIIPDGFSVDYDRSYVGDDILKVAPDMTAPMGLNDGETVLMLWQFALKDMPDGEGVLAQFVLKADDNVALGDHACQVTHAEASDTKSGTAVMLQKPSSFNIKVIEYSDELTRRVIEDTDENLPEVTARWKSTENVKVNRKIGKDTWSTICLPFAMSAAQMTQAFGEGVRLAQFKDYSTENRTGIVNGQEQIVSTTYTINFENINYLEEGIKANTPYIINITNAIESFNVDDVTVAPDEESVEIVKGKGSNYKGTITGTLKKQLLPNHVLFLSGNKVYSSNNTTMKAFRAYLELMVWDREGASSSNFVFKIDGETTSIEGLTVNGKETMDGQVYTLSGVHLGSAEELQGKLPSGIYIVNNKKMIVK